MESKLFDILSRQESILPADLLSRYLRDELDDETRFQVEKLIEQGGVLEEDAWEGWQISQPAALLANAKDINKHIEKALNNPKRKPRKKPLNPLTITWLLLGLILALLIIAWGIIYGLG